MSAIPNLMQVSTHEFRLMINGRPTPGASTLDVINPATGQRLTTCARADKAQLDEAVAAAKTAFVTWSVTSLDQRRQALLKIAGVAGTEVFRSRRCDRTCEWDQIRVGRHRVGHGSHSGL
jgi:delta 1-pyrroline-5-carboxylate dehydrogenase